MFRELIYGIFSEGTSFGGRCAGLLVLALLIFAALLILGMVIDIADSAGIAPEGVAICSVEDKDATHAYTTWMTVNNIMTPIHHPATHEIFFTIEGERLSADINRALYKSLSVGDLVEVEYGRGRISRSLHPIEVRLANR